MTLSLSYFCDKTKKVRQNLIIRKSISAQQATWVKTTLAPGSKVVTDYYDRSGLTPYMEKLGFNLVGYGCVTCIGNSGPLPVQISKAINENDLAVSDRKSVV